MGDIYTNPPQSRNEAILRATIDNTEYTDPPQSRIEDLLLELKEAIEEGGGGGTVDYTHVTNKPQINEVTLVGDKSAEDLGLQPSTLATPITIGGVSRTTVEAALGALEDSKEDTILAATPLVKEYDEVMRQDVLRLTMDTAPTANSGNAVTSGGVKSAVTATVELLKDTTGWTGKNKNVYPYQQTSKTSGNLTVTANSDSSIEANGTNDTGGYVDFAMQSRTGIPNAMWLPKGRYIVSVDYEGEYTGAYAYVGNTYNGAYHVLVDRIPFGKEGKLLVIDENVQADAQYKRADGSCLVAFYLGFPNGSTATNLKLYPMICDEDTYKISPSFEPPHESVAEMITYRSKTYSIRETVLNGFITSGSAEIHIFIAGRFDNITNVSIAPVTTWIRGIKGYLKDENGVDISGGTYSFADNLKVNQVVKSDFGLKVVIKNKNDGTFTNVDNNTPISVLFGGSGSITLS